MSDNPEHDPLQELLAPPAPIEAGALRRALLVATIRRLRRARWMRRAALAAALAACYGAGLLTMRLLTPAQKAPAAVAEAPRQSEPAPRPPEPAPPGEQRNQPGPEPDRAALLRQAGRRYLDDEGDPEAALRCYSKSLDAGTKDDTKFSPDDDWLMMAIKNAREKETRHANNDG